MGILEETASRRHQFVFGRRGVGKSTLLRKIESIGDETNKEVIFVDIETLRGRPYPDVLIELLIELLTALRRRLTLVRPWRVDLLVRRAPTVRHLNYLIRTLRALLDEPQLAERTVRDLRARSSRVTTGGALHLSLPHARGRASGDVERRSDRESTREARFLESKMDGLLSAAILIRQALGEAQKDLGEATTLIVLDDFYHVRYDDQPEVLAYLHQIVKNLDIFLKVCGVRHRIQPFVEGDPPRGMQLGQDAGEVSLDITLERFQAAQTFLETVLRGICEPLAISLDQLMTDGGRQRLVLGSGGVARDYLYLTQKALRISNEREATQFRPHNRISAEDVNEAAAELSEQKQQDLVLDAGENAAQLRERLSDVAKFCLDVNGTNVFLVEGPTLQEEEWGKQLQELADLRFIHEFGNLSVQTGSYRGRRFVGFTLDLSNYTTTRSERIRQIEFWTPAGKQETRRASLIYTPDATGRAPKRGSRDEQQTSLDGEDEILDGEWTQTTIFDFVGSS